VNPEILKWYYDRDCTLIPLRAGKDGKRPLHSEWTTREYSPMELQSHASNVGFRMGPRDLVVDVDARHGGLDSLPDLQEDYPEITANVLPAVLTGGGGYHFYMRLTVDQAARWGSKFREVLGYDGIEFKGLGRQVVIPGSIHPETGDEYEFDEFSNITISEIPPPPDRLLAALLITPTASDVADESYITAWSPENLKAALELLPVEEFNSNASWFPLMCAAYHATGGAGVDEFIEWSTSDPKYRNAGPSIRARWASLQSPAPTKRTAGTICHEISKRGKPLPVGLPGVVSAESEFEAVPVPATKERPTLAAVRAQIDEVTPSCDIKQIKSVLDDICYLDPLDRHDALDALARQSNRPKSVLAEALKRLMQSLAPVVGERPTSSMDAGDEVTYTALDQVYNKGANIITLGGQFWTYTGKYWKPTDQDVVGKDVMYVVRDWVQANPKSKKSVASLTDEVLKTLKRESSSEEDLLRLTVQPPPVINCLNGEIWIDERSGQHEFKPHDPRSYLTHRIDTDYDPEAQCPLFESTLTDIFNPLGDAGNFVIDHLWEMIGYTLQPRKNMPHWWLFFGRGANGKTVVLDVLTALLGECGLCTSLGNFNNGNNHATTDLVGKLALIDEDVEKGTKLPGELLKKITENKKMLANPKGAKTFQFVACTSVVMAANDYPRTTDISSGMRRRALVVPFMRIFHPEEQDTARAERVIESELPGVLNKALEGLNRLRARGRFDPPLALRTAAANWLRGANPLAAFFADCCTIGNENDTVLVREIWNEYQFWIQEQGRKKVPRPAFVEGMQALGHELIGGRGTPVRFRGIRMKPTEERDWVF